MFEKFKWMLIGFWASLLAPIQRSKFWRNVRGQVTGKIVGIIGLIVVFIMWLYITPTIAYQIDYVIFHNASSWNFTAAEGATAILGLGGFIWVVGGIIMLVGGVFSIMKWGE